MAFASFAPSPPCGAYANSAMYNHGRPQGGARGGHLPPLEFEKMTSYAAVLQNALKFVHFFARLRQKYRVCTYIERRRRERKI